MVEVGVPGDFYRGHGVSYAYSRGGVPFTQREVKEMFGFRKLGKFREVRESMENVDTVVTKYSLNKDRFDQDAFFPIYRAAGMHFYYAELFNDKITSPDKVIYTHDPYTNEITGYYSFGTDLSAKQDYLEDRLLEEKAREMAFEGERFYDLMRIAKRRGDPAVLADRVAGKFSRSKDEQIRIREHLMNEHNWYIHPW
jgi:hypothetical protein